MIKHPLGSIPLLFLAKENMKKTGSSWSAFIAKEYLPDTAKHLLNDAYHLEDICALDSSDGAVCVYHFAKYERNERLAIRVVDNRDNPEFPSITPIYQGAEWHEREVKDLYGYNFIGHPNLIPLLLTIEMVDLHPLKKADTALAPLCILLSSSLREIIYQADGFTLMDIPQAKPQETTKAASAKPQE